MACDQHVVKMPIETAQMLSTAARALGLSVGYAPTHARHPCTVWVGASRPNFEWALRHGLALCEEYTYRFHREHAAQAVLERVGVVSAGAFPDHPRSPFVQVMPKVYQRPDAVDAYREFYTVSKRVFARWRNGRSAPAWWEDE